MWHVTYMWHVICMWLMWPACDTWPTCDTWPACDSCDTWPACDSCDWHVTRDLHVTHVTCMWHMTYMWLMTGMWHVTCMWLTYDQHVMYSCVHVWWCALQNTKSKTSFQRCRRCQVNDLVWWLVPWTLDGRMGLLSATLYMYTLACFYILSHTIVIICSQYCGVKNNGVCIVSIGCMLYRHTSHKVPVSAVFWLECWQACSSGWLGRTWGIS